MRGLVCCPPWGTAVPWITGSGTSFVLLFLESQERSGSADGAQILLARRYTLHLLQASCEQHGYGMKAGDI